MIPGVCSITDCGQSPLMARGLCRTHYKRWYRYGDPLAPLVHLPGVEIACDHCGAMFHRRQSHVSALNYCCRPCKDAHEIGLYAVPIGERFWDKVDKSGDCWLWTACVDTHGYGQIGFVDPTTGKDRPFKASVIAWYLATGEILSPGLQALHTCDVPRCVRNDETGIYVVAGEELPRHGHIFKGTQRHNMLDMKSKGRSATGDRNGSRKHPERIPRGDEHYTRQLQGAIA